jgi:hypothetical protein
MKSLKPITTLVGGTFLLSGAMATAVAIVQPDFRNPGGVTICLVAGMVLGIFVFGPVAAGDAFRSAFVRRHVEQFDRWSAVVLAMGLGHWAGMGLGDMGLIVAFAFVFLGACFRVYLSGLARRRAA